MLKIWGKIVKNNKIIKDATAESNIVGTYQDNLKACLISLCESMDIAKPYWLPSNLEEYNRRGKVFFDYNNFMEDIDFDRFVIEELEIKE